MPWPDFVTSDSEPCRDDASMADRVHLAMFGQASGAVEKRPEPPTQPRSTAAAFRARSSRALTSSHWMFWKKASMYFAAAAP